MARRRSSPAEDLMDIVAHLPWWVGIVLAVVSYVGLHQLAQRPVPPPTRGTSIVVPAMVQGLSTAGQYLLPLICLAGAGMSAWRRRQRRQLAEHAAKRPASDALNGISWREFELLVGEAFRQQGYKVVEHGGAGPDGGVDLVLSKPTTNGSEKYLVQCKQWRAYKVGVEVVRELYGVMAATGAAGGYVVTAGRFTDEAVRFASGRNVTLIEGTRLHRMLQSARGSDSAVAQPREEPSMATLEEVPACPKCARPMVRRRAQRGGRAGEEFWGCGGFPQCRGNRTAVEMRS